MRSTLTQAEKPNVEMLVLPAETGAHASPGGSFEVFEMSEPYPAVGYVQMPAGGTYVEAAVVERLASAYDRLREAAPGTRGCARVHQERGEGYGVSDMTAREAAVASELCGITWRKSTRSGDAGGNCVEIGKLLDGSCRIAVRDSKNPDGPALFFTREEWAAFVGGAKDGEFDV
jgi:hypothetical protein